MHLIHSVSHDLYALVLASLEDTDQAEPYRDIGVPIVAKMSPTEHS